MKWTAERKDCKSTRKPKRHLIIYINECEVRAGKPFPLSGEKKIFPPVGKAKGRREIDESEPRCALWTTTIFPRQVIY